MIGFEEKYVNPFTDFGLRSSLVKNPTKTYYWTS